MMLSIDTIHENPANARHVEVEFNLADHLITSMRTIGLIQPVIVTPHPTQEKAWMLMAGHRRLRAARKLGWSKIAAMEMEPGGEGFVPETAISAAENMVRARMHPIDQWRAVRDLQDNAGFTLERAAAAIGVSLALARRMSVCATIDPSILAELAKQDELPPGDVLRVVSAAPIEVQQAALKRVTRDNGFVRWHELRNLCSIKKIPMERAIFDHSLIAWDEDFFAEADAGDRFTTKDIEAFLAHQKAALVVQIEKSKGRYMLSEEDKSGGYRVTIPRGWRQDYTTIPKRFAKDDPRKVYACLVTDQASYRLGCVDYAMAAPAVASRESDDLIDNGGSVAPEINKVTQQMLAEMKAEAVRERILQFKGNGAADMLRAMLMLFTMSNVTAGPFKGMPYNSIAQALVMPDGEPRDDVTEEDLCDMAAFVVRQAITFDHPKAFNGPGRGAEWLALSIGAAMPRTDTKEILRGVSAARLQQIAQEYGIDAMLAPGALRKAMIGKLPNWRLVDFGSPGPLSQGEDQDVEEQDEMA